MTRSIASIDLRDSRDGYVVRKPRASDAVGGSLRDIYDTDPRLPSDWASLLRRIDASAH